MTTREWFRQMRAADWAEDKEQLVKMRSRLGLEEKVDLYETLRTGPFSFVSIPVRTIEESIHFRLVKEGLESATRRDEERVQLKDWVKEAFRNARLEEFGY